MSKSRIVLPLPILFVLVALGFLFAIDLFALAAYRELDQAVRELNRRSLLLEALQPLPVKMLEMQSGLRGYLLTGSSTPLNLYRAAADEFPGIAEKAVALLDGDPRHQQLVASAAASARDWLDRYASPLVVKRSAGEDVQRTMKAILETMRKGPGESQAERIRAQFVESIRIEREHIAGAQLKLQSKLESTAAWMRGRAVALLLALAALALLLRRTLAKLAGQRHSREVAESAMRTSAATLRAMSEASPLECSWPTAPAPACNRIPLSNESRACPRRRFWATAGNRRCTRTIGKRSSQAGAGPPAAEHHSLRCIGSCIAAAG